MALLRPSELARVWELHPKTVYLWIREGRLPAIRTPGAQYRVRTDDARAYCEKNDLPMPRGALGPRVAVIGKPGATQRSLVRACKSAGADVALWPAALDGLVSIAAEAPDVVAIDARVTDVKIAQAIRVLRKNPRTARIPVIVYDAPAAVRAALAKIGASHVVMRGKPDDAARALGDLLSPQA
ncbi:MAG TPA: helix-turn-helix domain-containing protein [Labilithrix sp.]|jgi:excisionase family DNA binding protein